MLENVTVRSPAGESPHTSKSNRKSEGYLLQIDKTMSTKLDTPWSISRLFKTILDSIVYAQILILVNLILVNFGGFLVIARNPPDEF